MTTLSERGPKRPFQAQVLWTKQQQEWMGILGQMVQHDFHHLPQYQRVEEHRLKGMAHLFTYRDGDYVIALPLVLRRVGDDFPGLNDATSVYGYGGPVTSHQRMPEPVVRAFQAALREELAERHVIAVFSRLHPLIAGYDLLAGLGECRAIGQTVSIDLSLSLEKQRAQYRDTYKRRVSKQRREGTIACLHDEEKRHLGDFVSIYEETMRRVKAERSYFFGQDYFSQLACELGSLLHLFVAVIGRKVAAAGLFTICDGIVQYHLGGTRDEFLKLSPMALIFDTVRLWANEIGACVFHLGGRVGAREDSLFHFKAGFSDRRHIFATWRWIVAPKIYHDLCERQTQLNYAVPTQDLAYLQQTGA